MHLIMTKKKNRRRKRMQEFTHNCVKKMTIGKLLRLGRRQLLQTILSRETIKPSSPTPSHLRSYNLSLLDQVSLHTYIPVLFFYRNCGTSVHEKASQLKSSLSQILTEYYPFAGRFPTPSTSYVDCNDEGVLFLEARNDSKLDTLLHMEEEEQDETLDQLFPDGLVWANSSRNIDGINQATNVTIPLAVQLNHFACGGVAVAVSMSHKIGDGCTLCTFMNHWATTARSGSSERNQVLPMNPQLVYSQGNNTVPGEIPFDLGTDCVARKFVFPNSKLRELKNKVVSMAKDINEPTRVEVLTSLLYKCAVKAATPDYLCYILNKDDLYLKGFWFKECNGNK